MAYLSGTGVILYADGQPIALQKGLTVGIDADLPDASNKESGGWLEHIMGMLNAKIDFSALFSTGLMTDNPKVLSAKDLMAYITSRTSIAVLIYDLGFSIIGNADMSSLSFEAPMEGVMPLSGSLKINGKLYPLTGGMSDLIGAGNDINAQSDYDTIITDQNTHVISSAINLAGSAYCQSDTFGVTSGDVIKVSTFVTLNSGQLPTVTIFENGGAAVSNAVALVAGYNLITLTITSTVTARLRISNTGASNFSTTSIFVFEG